jgi:hypothetical protein
MQWSAVAWHSADPIRSAGARTPVVPWTGRCLRRCRRLHRASARPQMDTSGALGGDDEGKMGVISVSQTRLYSQSSL